MQRSKTICDFLSYRSDFFFFTILKEEKKLHFRNNNKTEFVRCTVNSKFCGKKVLITKCKLRIQWKKAELRDIQ